MELFDIVDDEDRVIGSASREDCHGNPELTHRAVHILVFNSRGDLYLQKRSRSKVIQPGMWDSSVGGHLSSGESYEVAGRREMAEELGISGCPFHHLFDFRIRNAVESENIRSFAATFDGPISPDPDEIERGRFWSISEIESAVGRGDLTPSFECEFAILRADPTLNSPRNSVYFRYLP